MPGERVNPVVVEAMRERGIDLSNEKPKMLSSEMVRQAHKIISMGCGSDAACPVAFVPADDWGLDVPADQPLPVVRRIRDEVEARIRKLAAEVQSRRSVR
jgi:arsenate reductase